MKIFLTAFLVLLLLMSVTLTLDEKAMNIHDENMQRAVVTFAVAKGLNGVISLIQGTELSITPVGLGLNFSVGEVLDPFNDMVERFSWVMLLASISLGIQKLLLILSSTLFLQVVFALISAIILTYIWIKRVQNYKFFTLTFRIMMLVVVLRFSAIVFIYTSGVFYNLVLDEEYSKSSMIVIDTKEKLQNIQDESKSIIDTKKESSWYELDVTSKYKELKSQLNISEKLDLLADNIEQASRNIINLITIFIVQTVLMPLLFIWLFIYLVKWCFRVEIDVKKLIAT